MNHLLRPRICPSFLASSGVDPCDVPFRYASDQHPVVARWHSHLRGLATAIHEISGLQGEAVWMGGKRKAEPKLRTFFEK